MACRHKDRSVRLYGYLARQETSHAARSVFCVAPHAALVPPALLLTCSCRRRGTRHLRNDFIDLARDVGLALFSPGRARLHDRRVWMPLGGRWPYVVPSN